ncbi:G2/M-specific cyclin NimE [Penicillium taxi]|uniref:G2/M-specific cyclin NimE n=1 Tax=Penicillium taxi TaxID=168475 RepID=UPI002544D95A|nr:G2/M-specific cyclin NimE [Penicillium taxi]KAJ5899133.1 G2/M-specific cyclin NimE [Penicillium taxi]
MPPPSRILRTRAVMNENIEPAAAATTRVTRAKAAATDGGIDAKKTKRSATTAGTTRRRPLEDRSNVSKAGINDVKDGKKTAAGKAGLASKATTAKVSAQTGGVQKLSRTSSRNALGSRTANKPEIKSPNRSGSGAGAISGSGRKRISKSDNDDSVQAEEPPLKKSTHNKTLAAFEKKAAEAQAAYEAAKLDANIVDEEVDEATVPDLDAEDLEDPLMVAEYVVEIFDYLQELEMTTLPNPEYIDHQPDLEWKMRGILVDWLIEVHTRFRLLPETLFLAVNIIDRFLSAEVVALDRLQLVGVTAMFIASKYEEVLSPHVANFSHVADETFSDKEILDAERHVLATLQYNISYPNPMNFLRRISKADNYDIHTRTLGKYLMEISLLDHRFMPFPQSQIAAASMYLARLILDRGGWDATLTHYAGYTEEEIDPVFRLMIDYLHRPVSHEAFFKKYASKKFLKASILTRSWAKKYHHIYATEDSYTYTKEHEHEQ